MATIYQSYGIFQEELSKLLENSIDAKMLFNILHEKHKPEDDDTTGKPDANKPGGSKWKRDNKFRNKNLLK